MDEAKIAELVAAACEEVYTSHDGILGVDWNDLGEVTIMTRQGDKATTFRLFVHQLGDDE